MPPNLPPQSDPPLSQSSHWVMLWSQSQNALHIEPVARMLQANRSAYVDNRRMDYVPLLIDRKELVEGVADSVRNTLRQREEGRVRFYAATVDGLDTEQIVHALRRAEFALRRQADALAKDRDYSAEFPAEDADRMAEAIELLTGRGRALIPHDN